MSFSNLHQHSDYSVHDGFVKIPELVSRAKELGYPALSLTDHGTVTGLIDFYLECKKQGIKPILGCEFYFTEEITVQDTPTYHLIMMAKDIDGYKNLMRLDTYAHAHFYKKPRIGMEAIEKYHEGLICTTACIAGPLSSDNHDDIINKLRTIFNEDLYIELQPHNFPEQIEYNNTWLSNKYADIKRIITLDSHYVWEKDIKYHKLWLFLNPESPYYASDDYYLRSEDDILKWFKEYNVDAKPMIANVEEIVSKCNVELDFSGQHYPIFCDDPATYVKNSIKEGYERLGISEYPNKNVYDNQIKHEFDVLQKLGYLNYFCIVGDMVKHCEETNIPIGLGRGSVVGCTIAWLMGITRLDPIKYNLVFERFANPERVTPPDVDTDVSTPQRDNLISYIKEKYGEVYQIRTASYLQDKSAVQRASMAINRQYPPDKPIITAKETMKRSKAINDVSDLPVKTKLDRQWKDMAIAFKGHIISYGCHASAVLVTPEDVCNWTAVEKQGDNMVACHDFHQLEKMGLLKLDILGLETLDIIKQTEHRAGINLDMADVPIDDESTALMLRRGDTEGCFQIESNVMTKIILRMNVTSVEDLISVVALGRPGPLDSGMVETFLKRRNKQEPTTYDIPELEPILGDTEGVIVYQEQIMKIAQKICGYTLGEADNLRRIIGRKVIEDMKPAIEDMIKRGMKNGYSHDQMKRLTDNIVTFASYGFNRGHSAAYGMTAWVTAYLKSHYPAAFMASLLDSNCKDKPKLATYIMYCMNNGIKILPPQLAHRNCYSGYDEDGAYIILGLNCIAGVGNSNIPKDSSSDFKTFMNDNLSLNKTCISNLVKAGVFDGNKPEMLQYITWAKDKRKSKGEFKYTEKPYNEQEEQSKVLGISFGNVFQYYNMDMVDNVSLFGFEILNVKGRKTKTGKPMAFVKARDNNSIHDLVVFNDSYKDLKTHKVYIIKLRKSQILDFVEANTK